jgi:L-threonylcarbamoyladenylate synthase
MRPTVDVTATQAAALLRRGGLLVYPTEAVWGLGCDPFDPQALQRLLALKQRVQAKGLILIAADLDTLRPLLDLDALAGERRDAVLASWPGPHTWAMPCSPRVPETLRGAHDTLAVRVTAHPPAAALCRAFAAPLVSTSANLAGEPPAYARAALDPRLLAGVDGVLDGETGGLERPTPIRDARSGESLRR